VISRRSARRPDYLRVIPNFGAARYGHAMDDPKSPLAKPAEPSVEHVAKMVRPPLPGLTGQNSEVVEVASWVVHAIKEFTDSNRDVELARIEADKNAEIERARIDARAMVRIEAFDARIAHRRETTTRMLAPIGMIGVISVLLYALKLHLLVESATALATLGMVIDYIRRLAKSDRKTKRSGEDNQDSHK